MSEKEKQKKKECMKEYGKKNTEKNKSEEDKQKRKESMNKYYKKSISKYA